MTPEERERYDTVTSEIPKRVVPSALAGIAAGLGLGLLARRPLLRGQVSPLKGALVDSMAFGALPFAGAYGGGEFGKKVLAKDQLREGRSITNRVGRRRNKAWRERDKSAAYQLGQCHASDRLGI